MNTEQEYDALCEQATIAAENRLLDHFRLYGGEVWTIGCGCEFCRKKIDAMESLNMLKTCSSCLVARFCNETCLKSAWPKHKRECNIISTLKRLSKFENISEVQQRELIPTLLATLGLSRETKATSESKIVSVAHSLQMNEDSLPGWFWTVNYELESVAKKKVLYQTALDLFAVLRDEESWARDKESFPRSSYTHVDSISAIVPFHSVMMEEFLRLNGHLVLFSIWMQHPEPPATQTLPFEERGFFGIVDSLLQISLIRKEVDSFVDSR